MGRNLNRVITILGVLCMVVWVSGCGSTDQQYTKTLSVSQPFSSGGLFVSRTADDSVSVSGTAINECKVTATVTAMGSLLEDAQSLADQTQIRLVQDGNKVTLETDKPVENVSISYDVMLPSNASVDLKASNGTLNVSLLSGDIATNTSNGSINISNSSGTIKANSSNGPVTLTSTSGSMDVVTSNGDVSGSGLSGNLIASTSQGNVTADYAAWAPAICDINITTKTGQIAVNPPRGFSASGVVAKGDGSFYTNMPMTVTQRDDKSQSVTVGTGQGNLNLKTDSSTITMRQSQDRITGTGVAMAQ